MIGFWDYTVVLTYVSFASAVLGMVCTMSGNLRWAVFCLAFCGFCDMFDGKIARSKKNRTEEGKSFGIQIDSLCDMVCFGALPIMICYKIGMNQFYSVVILTFYGLEGLIRLAYFNVMEEKRQRETLEERKFYQGLPITSMSIVLPIVFVAAPLFSSRQIFMISLHAVVALVGLLFILDFKFRKPAAAEIFILVVAVAAAVLAIIYVERSWWKFFYVVGDICKIPQQLFF